MVIRSLLAIDLFSFSISLMKPNFHKMKASVSIWLYPKTSFGYPVKKTRSLKSKNIIPVTNDATGTNPLYSHLLNLRQNALAYW
ncbi:hypothetical protein DN068_20310 [Taibaiella soli]|uniref:Uncharacterized protein n=1 Tax=Taibaiella soli TaxID=1649169 RepID=A0A2W2A6W1_9BACT|nr:hypothetical protein DN068_20310 [Taibaiella soli]